ncbi:MAG: restriction endonuclease subunit S [Saprospiraceae bacterium]|nr:restriction endonuclease subunit S [Saprospiraceae bacterium]
MKKYDKYKPSGAEWIGDVPEHWVDFRLKTFIPNSVNGVWGEDEKQDENDIVCIRVADFDMANLGVNEKNLTIRNIEAKQLTTRLLSEGELLIEKSGGGEKQTVGRVIQNTLKLPAVCSNFVGALKTNSNTVQRFLAYFFHALYSNRVNTKSIKQTTGIQNLDLESYLEERILLPPLPEQTAIARYLDQKTGEIDQLIAQKERQLALWEEEKTALINQAVTRGLDAGVKMKDSGVAWLEEVPEHWEVKKTKYLFKIQKRIVGELGKNILSITQKGIVIKDISQNEGQIASDYSKYQIVNVGDFAANHMDLLTGYVDISQFEGVTSPDYRVFTLTDTECNSRYFLYLMQMGYKRKIFYGFGQGASLFGRWRFPTDEFLEFRFPVPPLPEQTAIVHYIETQSDRISNQMAQTRKLIELLKEYRATLISEVVTGKINVSQ